MRKGDLTRRKIVALAAPVFNQKGFEGAALSDLMAATGLKKGGIYRHFPSKQKLAGDSFEYAWKIAIATRLEGLNQIPNTVDRLAQMIRNFRDRRDGLVPGGCPLLNTAMDSDDGNAELFAKARRALGLWLGRMRAIAREGQRRGEIRASVEPAQLATLIASTLEGSLVLSRLQRSNGPLAINCAHLEQYLESEVRALPRKVKPASDH